MRTSAKYFGLAVEP